MDRERLVVPVLSGEVDVDVGVGPGLGGGSGPADRFSDLVSQRFQPKVDGGEGAGGALGTGERRAAGDPPESGGAERGEGKRRERDKRGAGEQEESVGYGAEGPQGHMK